MTTEVQTPEKVYDGDGVSVSFAAPFRFLAGTLVVDVIAVDGTVTSLVEGVGYSVSGGETDAGGTVTLTSGALAPAGSKLRIRRNTARKQTAEYDTNDTFPAETHEAALDRLSLITQEQDSTLDALQSRGLLVPDGSVAPAVDLVGLLDGDILQYTSGKLQRLPRAGFAGKFYAGDASGKMVAASGTGNDPALREDLAQISGARLSGFAQGGAGSVLQSVEDKLRQVFVSPEDFAGYHGDGVKSDHEAVQRAFDYIASKGGGVLRIPSRHLLLDSAVIYAGNGLSIRGDNHGTSHIINGQLDAPAIQLGVHEGMGYRNEVSGVVFGQKIGGEPVLGNCGLLALNQSNLTIDRVHTFQFPSRLYDGVVLDRTSGSQIVNFGFQGALNRGFAVTNQSLDIYVSNGRSDGNGVGIEFRDVQGMYFSNVACYGNRQHALSMVTDFPAAPAQGNRYFQFFNVVGDTSGSHNWSIRQLSLANFVACWASTQLSQSINTASDGFFLSGENVEDITFIAPMAASNNRHGMNLDYCRSVVVDGARLGSGAFPEDWGGAGANNGKGGYGDGLFVGPGSNFSTITGGHYQENTDFGIQIASGAQRARINGVDLQFNQKGGLHNSAAPGQVRVDDCPGHNPRGFYNPPPAMIASDDEIVNPFDVDCTVWISGGSVSNVRVDGWGIYNGPAISLSPPVPVKLPVGSKIAITFASAPTWQWQGD